jgi:hypothetical protein
VNRQNVCWSQIHLNASVPLWHRHFCLLQARPFIAGECEPQFIVGDFEVGVMSTTQNLKLSVMLSDEDYYLHSSNLLVLPMR